MPVFNYLCEACGQPVRRLCPADQALMPPPCPKCAGKLVRRPIAPSTHVKEKLDNGAMPKAVERFADAERLYKERAGK